MELDFALCGGWVMDVVRKKIAKRDIGIKNGKIAFLGNISNNAAQKAALFLDIKGKLVLPGLIDAHTHHEMSLLSLSAFSGAVLEKGTTTLIADPHDTVNVLGIEGFKDLVKESRNAAGRIFFMAPPCVPASFFDESRRTMAPEDAMKALSWPGVIGLAEVMDIEKALKSEPGLLRILNFAKSKNKPIDGHMPGLKGTNLQRYLNATFALTDHESENLEEALGKNELGVAVIIRRSSLKKEFSAADFLSKAKNKAKILLATDGCLTTSDILFKGHMDQAIRELIKEGVSLIDAVRMASYNTARVYGIADRMGSTQLGLFADLVILKSVSSFEVDCVIVNGVLAGGSRGNHSYPPYFFRTIERQVVSEECFKIRTSAKEQVKVRAMKLVADTLLTEEIFPELSVSNNEILPDVENDILKVAIFSRHNDKKAIGFVKGFGFKKGAFAGSIAQDSQHIIAVGENDKDMAYAVNEIIKSQGALLFVENEEVVAGLDLPLAGIVSPEKPKEVSAALEKINAALSLRGCSLKNPYPALSWQLSIPSIPELKITVNGLVKNGNTLDLFSK